MTDITGRTTNGKIFQYKISTKLTLIRLNSNEIASIDLTQISVCKKLKQLWLSNNSLRTIDLRPLTSCTGLQGLYLFSNSLSQIDLAPLAHCRDLLNITLEKNPISEIDLIPLINCKQLQQVRIDEDVKLLMSKNYNSVFLSRALQLLRSRFTWVEKVPEEEKIPLSSPPTKSILEKFRCEVIERLT